MVAGNTRMTRSMAAAARDASNAVEHGIELKHEEPAVSLILINNPTEASLSSVSRMRVHNGCSPIKHCCILSFLFTMEGSMWWAISLRWTSTMR